MLKEKEKSNQQPLTFITTYNRTLPNLKKVIDKNWHILQLNDQLQKTFSEKPVISYRRNRNLKDIIGSNIISNEKVVRKKVSLKQQQRYCSPCNSRRNNLCCKQDLKTNTFKSTSTNEEFKIYHELTCKSTYLIYLLECQLHKVQYIGKCETPFNIRLNNHRKDVKNPQSIPACKHFNSTDHIYERDAKFILIEQLKDQEVEKEILVRRLKIRGNFWINKLKTLHPNGLNHELNNI